MNRNGILFWIGAALFLAAIALMPYFVRNEYPFFAGYVILQFIVLAVACVAYTWSPVDAELK